jgi:hypothetical protein
MTIENIDIQATIAKVQALMQDDEQMSATTKSMFEILIVVITLLKGVEMSPILAAYKYFIAIKWPVSHALFGSLSRGPAR